MFNKSKHNNDILNVSTMEDEIANNIGLDDTDDLTIQDVKLPSKDP